MLSPTTGAAIGLGLSLVASEPTRAAVELAPRPQISRTPSEPSPNTPVPGLRRELRAPGQALSWRSRLLLIPNAILARFLDAYSNSLCRKHPGDRAMERGAHRVDGCNFMIDIGYRHELAKVAIETSVGYGRLFMPDSNWLGRGEKLPSADFTQIHLHLLNAHVTLSRDFAFPRSRRWSWRVGGQLGVSFVAGNIWRTKLGDQTETCDLEHFGDLSRCRPYRAIEFDEPNRDPKYFADCDEKGCTAADLRRAGRFAEPSVPRVLPLAALFTGPRLRVHQNLGVALELGVGLGITVGVSIDGYFKRGTSRADRSEPVPSATQTSTTTIRGRGRGRGNTTGPRPAAERAKPKTTPGEDRPHTPAALRARCASGPQGC